MSWNACKNQKKIELFATNNQLLVKSWKLHSLVKKVYDEQSRTYVYFLKGKAPLPLMCLPKDKKNSLNICHPLIVFQTCCAVGANILIDIGITVGSNQRKRISISSNQRKEQFSVLSAALPLVIKQMEKWTHLLVDVEDIASHAWRKEEFHSIDSLNLGGVFYVKRVFTLRRDMIQNHAGTSLINYDELPKHMWMPKNITQVHHYISCSHNDANVDELPISNVMCSSEHIICPSHLIVSGTRSKTTFSHNPSEPYSSLLMCNSNVNCKKHAPNSSSNSKPITEVNSSLPLLSKLSFSERIAKKSSSENSSECLPPSTLFPRGNFELLIQRSYSQRDFLSVSNTSHSEFKKSKCPTNKDKGDIASNCQHFAMSSDAAQTSSSQIDEPLSSPNNKDKFDIDNFIFEKYKLPFRDCKGENNNILDEEIRIPTGTETNYIDCESKLIESSFENLMLS